MPRRLHLRPMPRRCLASILVSSLLLVMTAAVPASARLPNGFVGMTVGPPLFPTAVSTQTLSHQLDKMVASGVENLRIPIYWFSMQPYPSWQKVPASQKATFNSNGVDSVPTRFGALDAFVAAAAKRGLTILPTVLWAPPWDARRTAPAQTGIPKRSMPYANFLRALIRRYGPHGSFWKGRRKVPIRMWQIWNEPNERSIWPIQPFARTFVSLLKTASAAVKQADAGAKVVLPGFPNYSWDYLAQIYKTKGARQAFDVVAVHPYTSQPDGVITIISRVRAVMDSHSDTKKPIINDEFGWPSSVGQTNHLYGFETTETGQAANVSAVLPLLAGARAKLRLIGFDYHTWVGVEHHNAYTFDFSGLLRLESGRFIPKPALSAFATAALKIEGCKRKQSVATRCQS